MSHNRTKPRQWHVRPAKTLSRLHPPSLPRIFAVGLEVAYTINYPLNAQRTLLSDLTEAQADLSLRFAHMPTVLYINSIHVSLFIVT